MNDGTSGVAGGQGFRIDPEAYYSPRDVAWSLAINEGAQQHARQAGQLKHIIRGGPGNEHVVYRGKDLIAWLERTG